MTKLLKKYLLIKWWFPLLLFGLSIFQLIKFPTLLNTDFSIFFFILSGLILLASSIWQLFKGNKVIGFLQLSVLAIPMFFLGFIIYLFAGTVDKPDSELTIESIEPLIKEKTDLIIPKYFEILENLIEHTEGAFDSDYSIELTIKYKEVEEKYITKQILNRMDSKSEKGIWKHYENGFDFEHSGKGNNQAEPFYFKVDTLSNKIELNLFHL